MKGKHRTTFGASSPALASSLSSRNIRSSVKEVEGIPVSIKNNNQSKSAALLKAIKSSQNVSSRKPSRPKNFTSKLPVPSRNLVAKSLALVADIKKLSCVTDKFAVSEKAPELKANHFTSVKWKVNPLYLESDKTSFERPAAKDDSDSQLKGSCSTACSKDAQFIKKRGINKSSIPDSGGSRQRLLTVPIKPNGSRSDYTGKISCQHFSRKEEKNKCPASVKRCITSKAVAMNPYITTHVGSKINMNSLAARTSLASNNANKWRGSASMKAKHRTTFGASSPALASSLSSRNVWSSVKEVEGIPVSIKNKTQSKSAAHLKAIKSSQNVLPGKLSRPKNFTSKLPVPARSLVAKSLALVAEINKLSCVKDKFAVADPELKAKFTSVKWKVNPLYLENDETSSERPNAKDDSVSQSKRSCSTACPKDVKFMKKRFDGDRGMKKSSIPDCGGSRLRFMTVPIPNDIGCDYTGKISCQHSSRQKKECTAPSVNNHTISNKRAPILNKKVPSAGKGIVVVEKSSALSRRKQRRFKDDLINGTKPASISKEKKIKSKLRTKCEDASLALFSETGAIYNKEGEWLFSWEEACRWRAEIMSNIIDEKEWLLSWDEACRWRHERMAKDGEWLFS